MLVHCYQKCMHTRYLYCKTIIVFYYQYQWKLQCEISGQRDLRFFWKVLHRSTGIHWLGKLQSPNKSCSNRWRKSKSGNLCNIYLWVHMVLRATKPRVWDIQWTVSVLEMWRSRAGGMEKPSISPSGCLGPSMSWLAR